MYYPKSQIKTEQITYGSELQDATTKEEYKGFYWVTSKGEIFSGKNPDDKPSKRLEKYLNSPIDITTGKELYEAFPESYYIKDESYYNGKKRRSAKKAPRNPISSIPSSQVSERYFVSKTNEIRFIEVSKTEYQKFKNKSPEVNWSLFEPIKIPWRTKGKRDEVYLENKTNVLKQNIPGFELFFKGKYDKFWSSR
jgi:hypothetical protein